MRAERDFLRDAMGKEQRSERAEYLGAFLEGERRLVLVPMDPKEPWAAFKRMRSLMRQEKTAKAEVGVFAPETPLETEAKVIPLRKRIGK